jgi:hypothetical protein
VFRHDSPASFILGPSSRSVEPTCNALSRLSKSSLPQLVRSSQSAGTQPSPGRIALDVILNVVGMHTPFWLTVGYHQNHDSPRFLMPLRANCVLPSSPLAPPDTPIKGPPLAPHRSRSLDSSAISPTSSSSGGTPLAAAPTGVSDCAGLAPN